MVYNGGTFFLNLQGFFIAFVRAAAAAVERYISRLSSSRGIMQLVDYYIHLDDALFPW